MINKSKKGKLILDLKFANAKRCIVELQIENSNVFTFKATKAGLPLA